MTLKLIYNKIFIKNTSMYCPYHYYHPSLCYRHVKWNSQSKDQFIGTAIYSFLWVNIYASIDIFWPVSQHAYSKLLLQIIYEYCVYPAMSKNPKQLLNLVEKSRNKRRSKHFLRCPL